MSVETNKLYQQAIREKIKEDFPAALASFREVVHQLEQVERDDSDEVMYELSQQQVAELEGIVGSNIETKQPTPPEPEQQTSTEPVPERPVAKPMTKEEWFASMEKGMQSPTADSGPPAGTESIPEPKQEESKTASEPTSTPAGVGRSGGKKKGKGKKAAKKSKEEVAAELTIDMGNLKIEEIILDLNEKYLPVPGIPAGDIDIIHSPIEGSKKLKEGEERDLDNNLLEELVSSIAEFGVQDRPKVTEIEGKIRILCGNQRLRAAKLAYLRQIAGDGMVKQGKIVVDKVTGFRSQDQMIRYMVANNLIRKKISPSDERVFAMYVGKYYGEMRTDLSEHAKKRERAKDGIYQGVENQHLGSEKTREKVAKTFGISQDKVWRYFKFYQLVIDEPSRYHRFDSVTALLNDLSENEGTSSTEDKPKKELLGTIKEEDFEDAQSLRQVMASILDRVREGISEGLYERAEVYSIPKKK